MDRAIEASRRAWQKSRQAHTDLGPPDQPVKWPFACDRLRAKQSEAIFSGLEPAERIHHKWPVKRVLLVILAGSVRFRLNSSHLIASDAMLSRHPFV